MDKQSVLCLSEGEHSSVQSKLHQLTCSCRNVCAPARSDTSHGAHNFKCKLAYAASLQYVEYRRRLDGVHSVAAAPPGKRIGGVHFKEKEDDEAAVKSFNSDVSRLRQQTCRCRNRCPGAWSDTAHGSHGLQCKVAYGRFLTLREKFLTTAHSNEPNSGTFWGVFDFFAGTLAMCWAWMLLGVPTLGICEQNEVSLLVASDIFPEAALYPDARNASWASDGVQRTNIEALCGGFPCNPFSEVGPQLGAQHKDSDLIGDVVNAAIELKARWILLENVVSLVTKFLSFFMSSIRVADPSQEFLLISTEEMKHNQLAGRSQRHRVWPLLEHKTAARCLPPWCVVGNVLAPGCILDALPSPLVSAALFGVYHHFDAPVVNVNNMIRCGSFSYGDSGGRIVAGSLVSLHSDSRPFEVMCIHNGQLQLKIAGNFDQRQWWRPVDLVDRIMPPLMPGIQIKLRGDSNTYVLLNMANGHLHLFHDSRKRPRWFWICASSLLASRCTSIPAYSAAGVAPTIRAFSVPPLGNSFLTLAVQPSELGYALCIPDGTSLWKLHSLPLQLLDSFSLNGSNDVDIGIRVGRSMPMEMVQSQVNRLHQRILLMHNIDQLCESTSVQWSHVKAPSVKHNWVTKVVLCMLSRSDGGVDLLLIAGSLQSPCLPSQVFIEGESPDSVLVTAAMWASSLTDSDVIPFFAADADTAPVPTQVVIVPVLHQSEVTCRSSMQWISLTQAQSSNSPICNLFELCSARVASFGSIPHNLGPLEIEPRNATRRRWSTKACDSYGAPTAPESQSVWREGVTPVFKLQPATHGELNTRKWHDVINNMQRGVEELRTKIRGMPLDLKAYKWLQETADRIPDVDASLFPTELLDMIPSFEDPGMAEQPFPDSYRPPKRKWLDRKRQSKQPPPGFNPTGIDSLIMPVGIQMLDKWISDAMRDWNEMHDKGPAAFKQWRRNTNVLAIGQELFFPEARGIVWDLRKAHLGIVVPLDFELPFETHLDLDYLRFQCEQGYLQGYPDQEILSMLFLGVRYKDDLDLQLVLLPHLLSFADGCDEIQSEMEGLVARGWYSLHKLLPYAPGRNIPRGIAPKPGGKKRPTSEVGAPRKRQKDSNGAPVVPQNEAVKRADWTPEWKPTLAQFLQALAVLLHAAYMIGCPIFFFSDDEFKCFNQLRLAPEQWARAMCLLRSSCSGPVWASEYVMPFGVACASTIAQSWGHVLMTIVRGTMDEMEAAATLSDQELEWIEVRQQHFPDRAQSRLYFTDLYTDDRAAAMCGVDRTVRFMLAWFETTTRLKILMAPPTKRQLGCTLHWIGGCMLSCGIITVILQKRIRAMQRLRLFLAGKLTMAQLQKLNGLLEHFVHVFALRRNMMAEMYVHFDGQELEDGYLREPSKIALPTDNQSSIASRWMRFISRVAGCSASSYTAELEPLHFHSQMIDWHPDAANEDMGVDSDGLGVGLGAYAAGYWFNWPLSPEARKLPVPVLELLALAVMFWVFGPLFKGMVHDQCGLLIHCDSLASVLAVAFQRSTSRLMNAVLREMDKTPAFKSMKPHIALTQVRGVGNVMGDAASRGHSETLRQFTSQLKMHSIRIPVPKEALSFLDRMVAYCRTLSPIELDISAVQPMNADSASQPTFQELPEPPRRLPLLAVAAEAKPLTQSISLQEPPARIGSTCNMSVPAPQTALVMPILHESILASAEPKRRRIGGAVAEHSAWVTAAPIASPKKKLSDLRIRRRKALDDVAILAAQRMAVVVSSSFLAVTGAPSANNFAVDMFRSILSAVNDGTAQIDERDWEHWQGFCDLSGHPAFRDNIRAHAGHDPDAFWIEIMLQAMAFFHQLKLILPRSSSRNVPAKPTSVSIITTVRRIHAYFGITMATSPLYKSVLRSALHKFVADNGISALLPQRKEPFTNTELRGMVSVKIGTQLHGIKVDHSSRVWRSIESLTHVMTQTGLRLADALIVNRSAVHYEVKDIRICNMTAEVLPHMDSNSTVLFKIGGTKSDSLGRHFATFPAYLPFSSTEPVCAARILAQYDVDFPVSPEERTTSPLFCDDKGNRLQRGFLERVLADWCMHIGVDPATHSWHSFRITLAVCLKAAGADDSTIKSMVRWVSDASLKLYARDSRQLYASWLLKALRTNASSVQSCNLPDIDDDDSLAELQRVLGVVIN